MGTPYKYMDDIIFVAFYVLESFCGYYEQNNRKQHV